MHKQPLIRCRNGLERSHGFGIVMIFAVLAFPFASEASWVEATGGDATNIVGVYRIHVFTNVGQHTFDVSGGGEIEYLIVGGGGGGGSYGGGGAGGLIEGTTNVAVGSHTIEVGGGGAPNSGNSPRSGSSGDPSSAFGQTAMGGGGGGALNNNGASGGSGGGGGGQSSTGGAGTADQGNSGGSTSGANSRGGGGGGFSRPGIGSTSATGGSRRGGAGIDLSHKYGTAYGDNGRFAGGGGGSSNNDSTSAVGGLGGGGQGDSNQSGNQATPGVPTSGGGGGGGGHDGANVTDGGEGGSGIVIVRYKVPIPEIENRPATNVTAASAWLNGYLVSAGEEPVTVSVYWGDTDGGDPTDGLWQATNTWTEGEWAEGSYPTFEAGILDAESTWYYRYYATNQYGHYWSPTTEFAAPPAAIETTGAGAWNDGAIWDLGRRPVAGDEVTVKHAVSLSEATAELASFSIANATLTFTNWTTVLRADTVTIDDGGVVTLAPAFLDRYLQMSNRVHFICHDFTLEEGGLIDVDGRGHGPRDGPGAGSSADGSTGSGGSYGGRGGHGTRWLPLGTAYGSIETPLAPGSGGGGHGLLDDRGGSGGGAVRIEATGSVIIDGTISADGNPTTHIHSAGGSGGAIYISCDSFGGSATGILRADGGDAWHTGTIGGGGGGGRIAIQYQTLTGEPAVLFSVNRAARTRHDLPDASRLGYRPPQAGSLYFPDPDLLNSVLTARGTTEGINGFLHFGSTSVWQWQNSLTLESARLGIVSNQKWSIQGDLILTNDAELVVASHGELSVDGHLTLDDETRLLAYAGATNGIAEAYGALIDVGGTMTVAPNAWVYPFAHPVDGGAVRFKVDRLEVMADGGFNADGRGHGPDLGPGRGGDNISGQHGGGGGYGGRGGRGGPDSFGGDPYGVYGMPIASGSGGGRRGGFDPGGYGGGVIWIEAADSVVLDGILTADGALIASDNSGGGSGGGIFIDCASFSGAATAVIRADGQDNALGAAGGIVPGGGGGGRIAIWMRVPEINRLQYLDTGLGAVRMDAQQSPYLETGWDPPNYAGTLSAAPGASRFIWPDENASFPGSINFFLLRGTLFKFR